MPDGPIFSVEAVAGSSASDDGNQIVIGFVLPNGETFNLALSHQRAIDLIMQTAFAAGQAEGNRTKDPEIVYLFPTDRYEVGIPDSDNKVRVSLGLPNGPKLNFRFDVADAFRFHEALGSALGVNTLILPPGMRPN